MPYDCRRTTLDPGLTVIALRGLRYTDRHYPFIEGSRRPHPGRPAALREALAAWLHRLRSLVGALGPHPRGGDPVARPRITDR
jgi:hypothetical protein